MKKRHWFGQWRRPNLIESTAGKRAGRLGFLAENQFAVFHTHDYRLVVMQVAFEEFFGQWILEVALNRTPHRTRAVRRVVSLLDQEILSFVVQLQRHVLSF